MASKLCVKGKQLKTAASSKKVKQPIEKSNFLSDESETNYEKSFEKMNQKKATFLPKIDEGRSPQILKSAAIEIDYEEKNSPEQRTSKKIVKKVVKKKKKKGGNQQINFDLPIDQTLVE